MAVFSSTQELEQQDQHSRFKAQTGWKAAAMAPLFKRTGKKTNFNKALSFVPGMGLVTNLAGRNLSSGSSASEVIKGQTKDEMGAAVGDLKLGAEAFMALGGANAIGVGMQGAGAGGGATKVGSALSGAMGGSAKTASAATKMGGGLFGKAGTKGLGELGGATKAGAFISKLGGGVSKTVAQGGTSMFADKAGTALTDKIASEGKQKVMDQMNTDSEGMTEEEVLQMSESDYSAEADSGGSADAIGEAGDALAIVPVLGSALGQVSAHMKVNQGYDDSAKKIANKTTQGNASYRV